MTSLAQIARESDLAVARARNDLVTAVRAAAASGMTQVEIAREIGRSQPEVSRLLHFHGRGERAEALRKVRREVLDLVTEAGGGNVRVFGSVATGADRAGSDIDLVFTMHRPMGLMALGRLERRVEAVVGLPVDLVPESALRPDLAERVLVEAVPL